MRQESRIGVAQGGDTQSPDSEHQVPGTARERGRDRRRGRYSEDSGGEQVARFLYPGRGGYHQSKRTESPDRAVDGERLPRSQVHAHQAEGDPKLGRTQTPAAQVNHEGRPEPPSLGEDAIEARLN